MDNIFTLDTLDEKSIIVRYLITSPLDPDSAMMKLCKEQSLSHALGNDIGLIEKFLAKYLPNSITKINNKQFLVDIVFPWHNIENSLSMLLSAAGGDTFNIKDLYPIKIVSIKLPQAFIKN